MRPWPTAQWVRVGMPVLKAVPRTFSSACCAKPALAIRYTPIRVQPCRWRSRLGVMVLMCECVRICRRHPEVFGGHGQLPGQGAQRRQAHGHRRGARTASGQ